LRGELDFRCKLALHFGNDRLDARLSIRLRPSPGRRGEPLFHLFQRLLHGHQPEFEPNEQAAITLGAGAFPFGLDGQATALHPTHGRRDAQVLVTSPPTPDALEIGRGQDTLPFDEEESSLPPVGYGSARLGRGGSPIELKCLHLSCPSSLPIEYWNQKVIARLHEMAMRAHPAFW
jgi:hypothetical protein